MKDRQKLGVNGEDLAARFLQENGYTVLERNFRYGRGEIDIIAEDAGTIVFVEVKSRSSESFGSPEGAVDSRKQRQLSKLALAYLQRERLLHKVDCRFDVVAISHQSNSIRLIRNAFPAIY
jgi:putative endonuclease